MKISGSKLLKCREAANATRSELAVAADLTHTRIWQIETGDVSHVNSNIAKAMAKFLKVPVANLMADKEV